MLLQLNAFSSNAACHDRMGHMTAQNQHARERVPCDYMQLFTDCQGDFLSEEKRLTGA